MMMFLYSDNICISLLFFYLFLYVLIVMCSVFHNFIRLMNLFSNNIPDFRKLEINLFSFFYPFQLYSSLSTVIYTSVLTKPFLCTKRPKLTMLFYYIKKPGCSSPQSSNLLLIGAFKWGTVWSSSSIGIEIRNCQSWMYIFY